MAQENFGQRVHVQPEAWFKSVHSRCTRGRNLCPTDSGATENFMSCLRQMVETIFQNAPHDRPLYNVDGHEQDWSPEYYVDFAGTNRHKRTNMRFFLTGHGRPQSDPRYPWFAANQPKIDWARGGLTRPNSPSSSATRRQRSHNSSEHARLTRIDDPEILYIGRVNIDHV